MAKEGIDSFLLDCHTNDNLSEIEATIGIKGFAVIVRLWQKIYSEKGYYCEWMERSPLLFLANWFGGNSGVDVNFIKEVVAAALRVGIFDQHIYERYSVLTSDGIQKRYFEVVRRRTEITVISEYLLVSVGNFKGSVNKKSISADRNTKNVCSGATSKVKESKVKRSKGKESKENAGAGAVAPPTASQMIDDRGFPPLVDAKVREWVKYKIEKRQGYKETGLRNFLSQVENQVQKHGEGPVVELIGLCMSQNWQGVIWDKLEKSGHGRQEPQVSVDENGVTWPVIGGVDWSKV